MAVSGNDQRDRRFADLVAQTDNRIRFRSVRLISIRLTYRQHGYRWYRRFQQLEQYRRTADRFSPTTNGGTLESISFPNENISGVAERGAVSSRPSISRILSIVCTSASRAAQYRRHFFQVGRRRVAHDSPATDTTRSFTPTSCSPTRARAAC